MKKRTLIALVLALVQLATASVAWTDPVEFHVYPGGSIQTAIDGASDGDIIYVHEGTYYECLSIDGVDLRVIADGDVTVAPPAGGCGYQAPTVWIHNSTSEIDGFTVDGDYLGILARDDVDVTISNNTVIDYTKNGITVMGQADNPAYARITNNTIVGEGPLPYGYSAQNGIQLTSAEGILKYNTVMDNWYTGGYWTSTNVLLIFAEVQVLNNTLIDGQTGIYVYGGNNKVTDNIIDGETYGPYPADWPPVDPPQTWFDYGSWGVLLYGDNNKVVRNTIGPYDVGVENYLANNKVIRNTFTYCVEDVLDYGSDTKVHANAFFEE